MPSIYTKVLKDGNVLDGAYTSEILPSETALYYTVCIEKRKFLPHYSKVKWTWDDETETFTNTGVPR